MDNDKPEPDATAIGLQEPGKSKAAAFPGSGTKGDPLDGKSRAGLPVAEPFRSVSSITSNDRAGVFGQLVKADDDIAGLVAYSIYKQNKLDWLTAFEADKGRAPTADELTSYIIGEGTPRRIATYRHLAEATLAGNGPAIVGAGASPGQGPRTTLRRVGGLGDKAAMSPGVLATYGLIAVLFLIAVMLAWHYTTSSR